MAKKKRQPAPEQVDILKQKQSELLAYTSQFAQAISMVTETIDSLSSINESIGEKIREIDEYQSQLSDTKSGLDDAKRKNERIIHNFQTLLNTD